MKRPPRNSEDANCTRRAVFILELLIARGYKIRYNCVLLLINYFTTILIAAAATAAAAEIRPHIIFIMADDLGWNDVSFHGSDQILTPNIDALAYNGVILNNLYTQPVCTPSRAALMTGKYPIHLGMQGAPLLAAEPAGLPLAEKTLADHLQRLGYVTRAVGKWHLGFYKREYTPRFRGFQSFFGYYGGFIGYYTHLLQDAYQNIGDFVGYDLRRNEEAAWQENEGRYATDMFTDEAVSIIKDHDPETEGPLFLYVAHLAVHAANAGTLLEAPSDRVQNFSHILDPNRRIYAAMVSKLDDSIGEIVDALRTKRMLKDSVIVFMSDNGAPSVNNGTPSLRNFPNWGSNYPLRGMKGSLWEGAVRSPSFVWSAALQQNARVATNLMHVSDWLPTLYSAAGGNSADLPAMDGIDQWLVLTLNLPAKPRTSVLLNIDERNRNAAVRADSWKLIIGSSGGSNANGNYGDNWDLFDGYRTTYNVSAVMDSKSGRAIREIADAMYLSWASEDDINARRYRATVNCDPLPDDNRGGVPIGAGPALGANAVRRQSAEPATTSAGSDMPCSKNPCLFNVERDPCERYNVAALFPTVVARLYDTLRYHRKSLVPQITQPPDPFRANPKLWNYTWSSWIT